MSVQENLSSHSGKEKERHNFCRRVTILWVRSCGSHCKSEIAFCHGIEAKKGLGPSFGHIRVSVPEARSRMGCSQWLYWTPRSGLQERWSCQVGTLTLWYQEEKALPTFPGLARPAARQLCFFPVLVWQLQWSTGLQSASCLYGNWQAAPDWWPCSTVSRQRGGTEGGYQVL